MASHSAGLPPHLCENCPPNFTPIRHHCDECPDATRAWTGSPSDHLALDARFADHRLAIHQRRVGIERDLETRFPLDHVSPPGTRPFLDPSFFVHDVPWVWSPSYAVTGRPHPKLERPGVDVWGACAITGMPLTPLYYRQNTPRVDDGGLYEIFQECRRPDGQYSPLRLWEYRIDILDSRDAEAEAQRKLKKRQELLTRHGLDEQEVALEASLFSRAWNRGAPADDERPIIYGDLP